MKIMSAAVRKLLGIILLAGLFTGLSIPAAAQSGSTTLTTQVPATLSVQLEITGKGTVYVGGEKVQSSRQMLLPRHKDCLITFSPHKAWQLATVFLDGQDITDSIYDGSFLWKDPRDGSVLSVTFRKLPADTPPGSPSTGDPAGRELLLWGFCSLFCLIALALLITDSRKRSNSKQR